MAITKLDDIPKEATFGRLLFKLGEKNSLLGPAQIAVALYDNNDCYAVIQPGGRNKRECNKSKDISTIAKAVQRHFTYDTCYDVPSKYMYAYHILFACSMDYLYGVIDEPAPNATVIDISSKTGLTSAAVSRLMSGEEICMEEYLSTVNRYNLLESASINSDEEDEQYLETYQSVAKFWSIIFESDYYTKIPEAWCRMACSLYTSKTIKLVADDARKNWDTLSSWEEFKSWIEGTWNVFHPDKEIQPPYGMTLEEAYKKEPEWAMKMYREARYEHYYSATDKKDEYETVYWGCAGKFDRLVLDFFHTQAKNWCTSGPLPNYFDNDETDATK